jgi:hypothetical protein
MESPYELQEDISQSSRGQKWYPDLSDVVGIYTGNIIDLGLSCGRVVARERRIKGRGEKDEATHFQLTYSLN